MLSYCFVGVGVILTTEEEMTIKVHTIYCQNVIISTITTITMWQVASGAEAHQCWPLVVTNSDDIMNV